MSVMNVMHADSVAEGPCAGALVLPESLDALPGLLEGLPRTPKGGGNISVLHVVLDPSPHLPSGPPTTCLQVRSLSLIHSSIHMHACVHASCCGHWSESVTCC